jgi:hypothetical protein
METKVYRPQQRFSLVIGRFYVMFSWTWEYQKGNFKQLELESCKLFNNF